MDKAFILSSIIDEYQKVIDNLKASVERYKHESDIDEDNTLDPEDYARQTEAKDMQLRFEKMLNEAKQNLKFLEDSKSETKEIAEAGALLETDKNYLFIGVSVPAFKLEDKDVISFSENAPVYQNVNAKPMTEAKEIKENLIFEINKLLTNPLNSIKTQDNQGVTLLDALFEKSILPTYSFPKNIVGFYIEDADGKKIVQKPDRALELAINEYAPGKIVVIDKKTYKSGGIYNHYSKFEKSNFEKPARKFFDSEEYLKTLYSCTNNSCGWFGIEKPEDDKCPLCDSVGIKNEFLLKPWGFAPLNAKSIPEAEAENEASYAEEPCYSATPDRNDLQKTKFLNVSVATRSNQELIILNKGIKGAGFKVCKDCGASVPGQSNFKGISRPYNHPYKNRNSCFHNEIEEVFLGHNFNTDMTVFELEIDKSKINCEKNKNGKMILKNAAITLTEAIILASARILDVEFSEIKGGTRIRHSKELMYIDIFLFDSLSSGAGYSSQLANISEKLFDETKNILKDCSCDSSCHDV